MKKLWSKYSLGISRIPVLLTMVMIYWFSAQNGTASGHLSGNLTRGLLGLFLDLEAMEPAELERLLYVAGTVIRKLGHFTEFAALGFFLQLHIRQVGKRILLRGEVFWAWGAGILYAISDELHQGFVGGRHPAVTDVLIDSCGVLAGIGLLLLLRLVLKKVEQRNKKGIAFLAKGFYNKKVKRQNFRKEQNELWIC